MEPLSLFWHLRLLTFYLFSYILILSSGQEIEANITIVNTTSTEITLQWDSLNGSFFAFPDSNNSTPISQSCNLTQSNTSTTLRNLNCNTHYQVYLFYELDASCNLTAAPNVSVNASTGFPVVDNFTVDYGNPNTTSVIVEIFDDNGNASTNYSVSFLSSSSTETIYGSQTIEAKDLSPGESYNVQVSQFCGNHVNKSVFSEQKITMASLPITELKLNSNSFQIAANWKNPNGSFDSLMLVLGNGSDLILYEEVNMTEDIYTINVSNPNNETEYTLFIYTSSNNASSVWVNESIMLNVSAPTGFEASDQTTSEITLMWNEPANTLFSSYILSYSKKTTIIPYNVTTMTVKNLTPGTLYNFSLTAIGLKSNSSSATKSSATKSTITNLQKLETNVTTATIFWSYISCTDQFIVSAVSENNDNQTYNSSTLHISYDDCETPTSFGFEMNTEMTTTDMYSYFANSELESSASTPDTSTISTPSTTTYFFPEMTTSSPPIYLYNYTAILDGLNAGTNYSITVAALDGSESYLNDVITIPDAIPSLDVLQNPSNQTHSLNVSWNKPMGKVDKYNVMYGSSNMPNEFKSSTNNTSILLNDLEPGTNYTVNVTVQSNGLESDFIEMTMNTKPFPPSVSVDMISSNEITIIVIVTGNVQMLNVTWALNNIVQNFSIHHLNGNTSRISISNLSPATSYEVIVYSIIIGADENFDSSNSSSVTSKTRSAKPSPPNDTLFQEAIDQSVKTMSSITFILPAETFSNSNGDIENYAVIVAQNTALTGAPDFENLKPCQAGVAILGCIAKWTNASGGLEVTGRKKRNTDNDVQFVVGDGQKTNSPIDDSSALNPVLSPGTQYQIAVAAKTADSNDLTSSNWSGAIPTEPEISVPPKPGLIAGIVIAVVHCIVIVVVFCWYQNRRQKSGLSHGSSQFDRSITLDQRKVVQKPIRISDFKQQMILLHADSDFKFSEEFEELKPVGRDQSTEAALIPENRSKNRYTNILPYDVTRVKLQRIDGDPFSDYINANYLPGSNDRQREYIAAQGPLAETKDDFWRMVWEQNSRNIVMLTKTIEIGKKKCDRYWPYDNEPINVADLVLQMISESSLAAWTIREFTLSKGTDMRSIRQFHYMIWPDHGVPENTDVVKFVKCVRQSVNRETKYTGPTVVHCSAGVGRTGTWVVIDRLLQELPTTSHVDIHGMVHQMRMHRNYMVQTEVQYIFLHQVVLDYINGVFENDEQPVYENTGIDDPIYENTKFSSPTKSENGVVNQALISLEDVEPDASQPSSTKPLLKPKPAPKPTNAETKKAPVPKPRKSVVSKVVNEENEDDDKKQENPRA